LGLGISHTSSRSRRSQNDDEFDSCQPYQIGS
jgi:hypothetical protein